MVRNEMLLIECQNRGGSFYNLLNTCLDTFILLRNERAPFG